MQGLTEAYPALVVFAPEAGRQRSGETICHICSMKRTTHACAQKGELAGLSDLLDEGAREREHRWLQKSWLSTWVGTGIPGGADWVWGV